MKLAWGAKVEPDFRVRVLRMAVRLACDPSDLMAAMAFETARTFNPAIRNKLSGATGLIQFMPATAADLNTTTDALAAMTAVEQLDYVERYFNRFAGKLKTLTDVYMAILWPAAVGKPDEFVLFAKGSKAYEQNAALDVNGDGAITKAEATSFVAKLRAEGLERYATEEREPLLDQPAQESSTMPVALPLLAQLIPQVLGLFTQRAQATIAEKTGADPKVAAEFMQNVIRQVGASVGVPVVSDTTATQAVAALTSAAPEVKAEKVKALEAQAVATLDELIKAGDAMSRWDQSKWAAELQGRAASSQIAIEEHKAGLWDMTRTVVWFAACTLTLLVAALLGALIYQAVTGERTIDSGLLGLSGPIFMAAVSAWAAIIAFRFDGTKEASEQSKALISRIRPKETL